MKHTGTQDFETQRLICRRFAVDDWKDMLDNWASDPEIQSGYGEPVYEDASAVRELLRTYLLGYMRQDFYRWAIIEKNSGRNIGQIAFCRVYDDIKTAEIEYCIGRGYQGRGYAGEALEGLIWHVFDTTEFEKLEAYHRLDNPRSGRVLEKSPMTITDMVARFGGCPFAARGKACYCVVKNV